MMGARLDRAAVEKRLRLKEQHSSNSRVMDDLQQKQQEHDDDDDMKSVSTNECLLPMGFDDDLGEQLMPSTAVDDPQQKQQYAYYDDSAETHAPDAVLAEARDDDDDSAETHAPDDVLAEARDDDDDIEEEAYGGWLTEAMMNANAVAARDEEPTPKKPRLLVVVPEKAAPVIVPDRTEATRTTEEDTEPDLLLETPVLLFPDLSSGGGCEGAGSVEGGGNGEDRHPIVDGEVGSNKRKLIDNLAKKAADVAKKPADVVKKAAPHTEEDTKPELLLETPVLLFPDLSSGGGCEGAGSVEGGGNGEDRHPIVDGEVGSNKRKLIDNQGTKSRKRNARRLTQKKKPRAGGGSFVTPEQIVALAEKPFDQNKIKMLTPDANPHRASRSDAAIKFRTDELQSKSAMGRNCAGAALFFATGGSVQLTKKSMGIRKGADVSFAMMEEVLMMTKTKKGEKKHPFTLRKWKLGAGWDGARALLKENEGIFLVRGTTQGKTAKGVLIEDMHYIGIDANRKIICDCMLKKLYVYNDEDDESIETVKKMFEVKFNMYKIHEARIVMVNAKRLAETTHAR
jgi:hypothetical protein